MKDRIRQIMESQHMTQQEFANYVGMSAAALSSIFNERTKPTLNTVEAIKNKISGISLNWLMFGIGDMYEGDDSAVQADSTGNKEQMLDFNEEINYKPQSVPAAGISFDIQRPQPVQTPPDTKCYDRPQRKITEIRVFFDDQTYESFVPKK